MVSVSEDCSIKLWDTNQFQPDENVDPYISLREHTGPIFTVAGLEI
jgi:striatin 1/3/4